MLDITCLTAFLATAEQDDPSIAVPAAVHSIACSDMNPELQDPFAYRFHITQIPVLDLAQSLGNPRLRYLVSEPLHPFLKGRATVLSLVVNDLVHQGSVA